MVPRWGTQPLLAGSLALAVFSVFPFLTQAIIYKPELADYNLNTNQYATVVTNYSTTRANGTYTPSPSSCLVSHLDYMQSMGVGLIFIAGTPFVNMPWQADST